MTIHMIWAEARNRIIGCRGTIPWQVTGEQRTFRERTAGATVVMGRSTWESLPDMQRPLAGRRNIVLTRDRYWSAPGAIVLHHPDQVAAEEFWVIGGSQVYLAFLSRAHHVVRTRIDLTVRGDAYAPWLSSDWTAVDASWPIMSPNGIMYKIEEFVRGTG